MRKTRLVILPGARCLNQLGCLLLFLACPMIAFKGQENREVEPYCKLLTLRQRWLSDDQGRMESSMCTKDGSEFNGKENYAFWKNDNDIMFDDPNVLWQSSRESSNSDHNWNNPRRISVIRSRENRIWTNGQRSRAAKRVQRFISLERLERDARITRDTQERQSEMARSLHRATMGNEHENRMTSRTRSMEREQRTTRLARDTRYMERDDARSEQRAVSLERLERDAQITRDTRARQSEMARSHHRATRHDENDNRMTSRTRSMEREQRTTRQARDTRYMERDDARSEQRAVSLERLERDARITRDTRARQSEMARSLHRATRHNENENRMSSRTRSMEREQRTTRLARSERRVVSLERLGRDVRITQDTRARKSEMARSLTGYMERDDARSEQRAASLAGQSTPATQEHYSDKASSPQRSENMSSRTLPSNREERTSLQTGDFLNLQLDDMGSERRAISLQRQQRDIGSARGSQDHKSEIAHPLQRAAIHNKNEIRLSCHKNSMESVHINNRQIRDGHMERYVARSKRQQWDAGSTRVAREHQSEMAHTLQHTTRPNANENRILRSLSLGREPRNSQLARDTRFMERDDTRSEQRAVFLERLEWDARFSRESREHQSDMVQSLQQATRRNANENRISSYTLSFERKVRSTRPVRDIRLMERDDSRSDQRAASLEKHETKMAHTSRKRQSEKSHSLQHTEKRMSSRTLSLEMKQRNRQSGDKVKFNKNNLPSGPSAGLNDISDIVAELEGQHNIKQNIGLMSFIPSFICDKVSSGFDVLSKRLWNYTVNVPGSESMNGFISGGIMAVSLLLSTHKRIVV